MHGLVDLSAFRQKAPPDVLVKGTCFILKDTVLLDRTFLPKVTIGLVFMRGEPLCDRYEFLVPHGV